MREGERGRQWEIESVRERLVKRKRKNEVWRERWRDRARER